MVGKGGQCASLLKNWESNNDKVQFIFMNPTGNYHVPLKYFLENNNFTIYMVDARKTLHLRKMMNLNTIKSDSEDAHILAATGCVCNYV